jgi:hypothetical protein
MHPEIRELIKLAMADGEITEKKRAIILRKAENLGEDKDEVEMIIDGEVALAAKEQIANQSVAQPKSNKEGVFKKCPSCGAAVQSFTTVCTECGYEYQDKNVSKTAQELFDLLAAAEKEERRKPDKKVNIWVGGPGAAAMMKEEAVVQRLVNIVANFPIPTTKTDILEFLSHAVPLAKNKPVQQKVQWMKIPFNGAEKAQLRLAETWYAKANQVIIKARFSMKDDKKTVDQIENCAKQLGIK